MHPHDDDDDDDVIITKTIDSHNRIPNLLPTTTMMVTSSTHPRRRSYLNGSKKYSAGVALGFETTTLDMEGNVTRREPFDHVTSIDLVQQALPKFVGNNISQIVRRPRSTIMMIMNRQFDFICVWMPLTVVVVVVLFLLRCPFLSSSSASHLQCH